MAFGCCLSDDENVAHQANEFWKLDSIGKNYCMMSRAVLALDKLQKEHGE
ncbi:hypothetical protein H8702_03695 [Massilimaliae timonensis]|uniref:Uncharacterized protein n=1 Tax=Massiliimalia timonensis TaxID=1987501 RepID=A0A8J6TTY8_9FIRM|nr:M20 family metallopeptidase [Massiliimalia timonensis]MBC8610228.1 hypothetical protein [Massiliimalia timonensis]MBS7176800.1 hypothetical protein [Clostridiales bacterium]